MSPVVLVVVMLCVGRDGCVSGVGVRVRVHVMLPLVFGLMCVRVGFCFCTLVV